jgi:hypothetical protein
LASSVSNGKWKGKGRLDSGKSFSCFIKTQSLCSMGHGLLCF